jgi:hypothetical protein
MNKGRFRRRADFDPAFVSGMAPKLIDGGKGHTVIRAEFQVEDTPFTRAAGSNGHRRVAKTGRGQDNDFESGLHCQLLHEILHTQ